MSKKPSTQRLVLQTFRDDPFHRKYLVNAHLSSSLRGRLGIRSMPVREGDTVRIVKGDYAGRHGRVRAVHRELGKIEVVGITEKSGKGDTIYPKISISNVEITRLNLRDKWRRKIISRKTGKEITAEVEREISAPEEGSETQEEEKPEEEKPKESAALPQQAEGQKQEGEQRWPIRVEVGT
ncbi:50S ribosomal protein L24 [Tardisphaera saccharovorans]